jgi:hypothetical protein
MRLYFVPPKFDAITLRGVKLPLDKIGESGIISIVMWWV